MWQKVEGSLEGSDKEQPKTNQKNDLHGLHFRVLSQGVRFVCGLKDCEAPG